MFFPPPLSPIISSSPLPSSVTDKLIGKYQYTFKNRLGEGSYSQVFLGINVETKAQVAIKVVNEKTVTDPFMKKMLIQEIEVLKAISHPNLVKLFDVIETVNNIYIVQEYCNGGDLLSMMKKKQIRNELEAVLIFQNVLKGFKELVSKCIAHRDIKPANIFIHDGVFKIGDFGFARKFNHLDEMVVSPFIGTPFYMSPQLLKSEYYSMKCDIFSLGILFFEILYGRMPWPAESKEELLYKIFSQPLLYPDNVYVSPLIKDFITRCLQVHERDRMAWSDVFRHPLFSHLSIPPPTLSPSSSFSPSLSPSPPSSRSLLPQKNIILSKLQKELPVIDENFDASTTNTEDALSRKEEEGGKKEEAVRREEGGETVVKRKEEEGEKLGKMVERKKRKGQEGLKMDDDEKEKEEGKDFKERAKQKEEIKDDNDFVEYNTYVLEMLKFLRFLNSISELTNEVNILSKKTAMRLQFIIAKKTLMISAALRNMKNKGENPLDLKRWDEYLKSNLFNKTSHFFEDILISALDNYKVYLEGDNDWMDGVLKKSLEYDEKNMHEFCALEKNIIAHTILETIHFINDQLHRQNDEKEEQFNLNVKFLCVLIKNYKICIIMKMDHTFWTSFKGFGFDRTARFLKNPIENSLEKYKEWREEFYELHK